MSEHYTRNAIFSRVYDAVTAQHSGVYVASIYTPKPSSFPAVFVYEVSHFSPVQNVTLMNDDEQYQSTYEVQVISNDTKSRQSECYDILDAVKSAFKPLFYYEISENPITISDETTYRLVARFRRTIGGGDIMPQTNTENI